MPFLSAQSLVEYGGISSNATWSESIGNLPSRFWDAVSSMDQNTLLAIGGALLILAFLTRRSRRH